MDIFILHAVNNLSASSVGSVVSIALAQWLIWVLLAVVVGLMFKKNGARALLKQLVVGVVLLAIVFGVVNVIKMLVQRDRPFIDQSIELVISAPTTAGSFPSSHAALAVAIVSLLYIFRIHVSKQTIGVLVVLALLVGVGRIMVGVHFPSDVLVGFVVGAIIPFAAKKFL
ncbi:MAG: phosphatase PAP2 family protein [Candidatus Jacksonbacteria bacterium]|jgi:undecaprenyl-diphosphatase|nr:phosphatase PAP2 family protein [Candidatus Jacksonbacteria bacterium]MBT6034514.1 phosphatase PAP2 family protein [Candidatus Jacksonbacteria bacterium]MBT6301031.1 phosphatase PAP2 family protein [Candidatus Jacksonbacteria bacterium]MBT6756847.1 phosphatase PAP2 family protein [Candidatus Jacksonbacteria bacterium]MBT6955033.1 phosphatase PAP2 family protein [Candidatus Jacksonbacteria bacterium]